MTDTADVAAPDGAPPGPSGRGSGENVLTVTIDGRTITAAKGELVIDAAERNGVYLPRFCYHSRMKPVGMCRMCIVEVDCTAPRHPTAHIVHDVSLVARSHGRALNRYGVAVSAPTGQICTVLPLK